VIYFGKVECIDEGENIAFYAMPPVPNKATRVRADKRTVLVTFLVAICG
jgi:hypothetical protein